jgi:D-sedoheptulose 7-phosphate isomerase
VIFKTWLQEVQGIAKRVDVGELERLCGILQHVRADHGRVFVCGVGGSAANASHCVNDLRMRAKLDAYAPTDNVAELTARLNDEPDGWVQLFTRWLECARLGEPDAVLILSTSGETLPLVAAAQYAFEHRAHVLAILGRHGSTVAKYARVSVVVPGESPHRVGHAEAFQAVLWHAIVEELAA